MVLAGEDILASDIIVTKYIRKAAAESVTSSATLQNDDDIVMVLTPGSYRIEAFLGASSASATPNIKVAWTFSGTVTANRGCLGPGLASIDNTGSVTTAGSGIMRSTIHGLGTSVSYGIPIAGSSGVDMIREILLLEVSVTGTLQLQWAQNTSNATATTLATFTHIIAELVEAP